MNTTEISQPLVIKSIPENISIVEDYIDFVLKTNEIDENVFGNILISVIEGANNAILHGNGSNPEKNVTISHLLSENKKTITFIISDEGTGFNYNSLPDPTAPENIENLDGRGVFLMKQLADYALFQKDGSVIELTFKI